MAQRDVIRLTRGDAEAAAQAIFEATPKDKRALTSAPTLEDMLVSGSPANALLAATFVDQAQPLVIRYVLLSLSRARARALARSLSRARRVDSVCSLLCRPVSVDGDGGCRRRLQLNGDELHVTIDTHAKTAQEGERGVARLAARLGGTVQSATDCSGGGGGAGSGGGYDGR